MICAASLSRSEAVWAPSIQRALSLSSISRLARGATGALPRVQMRAPTSPRTASSSASTATIGWTKNPGVLPSPPGPRPLRPAQRAKLISLVSCAHTTRRPAQARTVRMLDASMIVSTLKRGDDSRRCTATSPDRVPPMVLSTNDPVETIRSNSSTLRASTRGSPRPSSSIQKPQSSLRPLNQSNAKIETNFRASRSPWRGRVGSHERSECVTGWGDVSTRTVRNERPSPHPAAHCIRVDPPPPGGGERSGRLHIDLLPPIRLPCRNTTQPAPREATPGIRIMSYVLAIDQGTTSSRAIVFRADISTAATAQQEFPQHFPASGWVEHEPEDIWTSTIATCRGALKKAAVTAKDIAAIGITHQRETTVVWDRVTGQAVHRAIVWQDRRPADMCAKLKAEGHEPAISAKTGLIIDPYFSGTKVAWILDSTPGARARAMRGELMFGTVDCYLLWRRTGGEGGAARCAE